MWDFGRIPNISLFFSVPVPVLFASLSTGIFSVFPVRPVAEVLKQILQSTVPLLCFTLPLVFSLRASSVFFFFLVFFCSLLFFFYSLSLSLYLLPLSLLWLL